MHRMGETLLCVPLTEDQYLVLQRIPKTNSQGNKQANQKWAWNLAKEFSVK